MATVRYIPSGQATAAGIIETLENRLVGLAALFEERCQAHVHASGSEQDLLVLLAVAPTVKLIVGAVGCLKSENLVR